jgi:arylsulfatase A-like enzyme
VRSIDLAPTLLDLVGVKPDPRFQGHSLMPYLQRKDESMDLAFFGETSYLFFKRKIAGEEPLHIPPMDETTYIDPEFDFHFVLKSKYQDDVRRTKERCLRTERFKLCRTPGTKGPIYRLFDLPADPHCERDVKADYPEVTARMSRALERWANEGQESRIREILGDIDEHAIVARK